MFCPECDAIMNEVGTISASESGKDFVVDLFECPECHCIDDRPRTRVSKKFELPGVA